MLKPYPFLKRGALCAILLVSIVGCQTPPPMSENIGYRLERHQISTLMTHWRECNAQANTLDQQARLHGEPARYWASAKTLDRCIAELGEAKAHIPPQEQLRSHAMGVQNYLKGGDIEQARKNFARLKQTFPKADLQYVDGASFITTMQLLLGIPDSITPPQLATANVGADLKNEMRRLHYWTHH